jgi:hypothetical protein
VVVKLLDMTVSRDTAAAPAGVSFEVDRFAWADGRLEVFGRWYGIRGRRFLRPTLDVEVDGIPRRMLAVLEHKPWAADDGEEWVAAFDWEGEPVALAVAELAVAPELAVVLPPPSGGPAKKARRARPAGERLEAAPPRAQALEAELTETRAEAAVLRDRLAAEQKAWQERVEQVEALRDESAAATSAAEAERDETRAARDAALADRDEVASARDEATAERDAARAERDAAVAARDAARADAAKAAAERARAVRDKAAVEHELAAAIRARDKARQERNEWLTRARDAAAGRGTAGKEPGREAEGHEAAPQEPRKKPAREAPRNEPAREAPRNEPAREAPRNEPAREAPPNEPAREAPRNEPAREAPRQDAAREAPRQEAAPAQRSPAPATPEPPPAEQAAPPEPAADAPKRRLPGRGPAPPRAGKPRKSQIPPGGILLPPTGPGSHLRRSILPAWAPRVVAPILLVILVVVIALLIAWAF